PIDVVYRRLEGGRLDPLDARAAGAAGVPAITWAAQAGGVVLANSAGSGLVEAVALRPFLGAAARALLGEELALDVLGPGESLATAPGYTAALDAVAPARVV